MALLSGAVATVIAAGLLMWRHQAGARRTRAAGDDAAERILEAQAVRDVESPRGLTGVRRSAQPAATALGSLGRPRTRSPTMLRWISAVPPQMVSERQKKNDACRSLTG